MLQKHTHIKIVTVGSCQHTRVSTCPPDTPQITGGQRGQKPLDVEVNGVKVTLKSFLLIDDDR